MALCSIVVTGQDNNTPGYDYHTDTLTYGQYLRGDWEKLRTTAKQASKNDISFYYLHLREAYASFYTQRYTDAFLQFNKASEYKQTASASTQELHYLSALYTQRTAATDRLYHALPKEVKEKHEAPSYKVFEFIEVNQGYNTNSDFETLLDQPINGGNNSFEERILLKNLQFTNVSMQRAFNSSWTVDQSIQHMKLNRQQNFSYLNGSTSVTQNDDYSISTTQWQYHIKASYNSDDKFSIVPALTVLNYNAEAYIYNYNSSSNTYTFTKSNINDFQTLLSLSLNYRLPKIRLAFNSNKLSSGDYKRWQVGGGITIYPFKSDKYYFTTNIYSHDSHFYKTSSNWETIWQVKAGWTIDRVWMAAVHSQGNHQFFADNDGDIIYNNYEQIQSQSGGNIHVPFFAHKLWFNVYYRYVNYQTAFSYVGNDYELTQETVTHNNHSITGGLSWHF